MWPKCFIDLAVDDFERVRKIVPYFRKRSRMQCRCVAFLLFAVAGMSRIFAQESGLGEYYFSKNGAWKMWLPAGFKPVTKLQNPMVIEFVTDELFATQNQDAVFVVAVTSKVNDFGEGSSNTALQGTSVQIAGMEGRQLEAQVGNRKSLVTSLRKGTAAVTMFFVADPSQGSGDSAAEIYDRYLTTVKASVNTFEVRDFSVLEREGSRQVTQAFRNVLFGKATWISYGLNGVVFAAILFLGLAFFGGGAPETKMFFSYCLQVGAVSLLTMIPANWMVESVFKDMRRFFLSAVLVWVLNLAIGVWAVWLGTRRFNVSWGRMIMFVIAGFVVKGLLSGIIGRIAWGV